MNNPIRILCLFTVLDRGGAETMCMNLYRNIDRTKVQFDFLVYYQKKGDYDDEVLSLGGRIYRIPHLRHLVSHIHGARAFFKRHPEYHIVHNHMQSDGSYITREAKKAGVKTIIYHSHFGPTPIITNSFNLTVRRALDKYLNYIALKNSTDFLACGETAAVALPEKYNAIIIRNAINIELFKYNQEIRNNVRDTFNCTNKIVIGHVGRLDKRKNQLFAVEVFKNFLQKNDNAELWLIGDGELKPQIISIVGKYGLESKVRLLGIRADVNELLQAMDIFIFPSIAEGLPVACIEAQTSGLPCVFSDGFDSHTVITDNCRILSLNDSVERWVSTILDLCTKQRTDKSLMIKSAGYDISQTSKFMEEYYLSKYK